MSLSLKNVNKNYGSVVAVRDLSLSCPSGQMLALLGPSGCGKSTTLKMIAGIESLTSGSLSILDREVKDLAPGARNIAMVFEDYALYPHYSVFENIAFPLRARHAPKSQIKQRVGDVIDLLRLNDIADERVKSLSGGAQQRVSIGRALVRDPDVVLFDEPLSHLDADQKVQLRTEIRRLQLTQKLTSVLVTHDQNEAMAMADLIAVMDQGVLQQVGVPQELYDTPANTFVAAFIGEPPMNLLDAAVQAVDGQLKLVSEHWELILMDTWKNRLADRAGKSVIVGIRPDRIRLNSKAGEGDASFTGSVFFGERRGDTDVLLVDVKGGQASRRCRICADIPGSAGVRERDEVEMAFSVGDISVFDSESRRNIECIGEDAP